MKLVDKDTLLKEREAKKRAELEKAAERERKKGEAAAAQAVKDAQRKIPPSEIFKSETDKYSKFDENVNKTFPLKEILFESCSKDPKMLQLFFNFE